MQYPNEDKVSFHLFPEPLTKLTFCFTDCGDITKVNKSICLFTDALMTKTTLTNKLECVHTLMNAILEDLTDILDDKDSFACSFDLVCKYGKDKHKENFWQTTKPENSTWSTWYDAALRHLYKYYVLGEEHDQENYNKDKPRHHLACALWNLSVLYWYIEHDTGIDDLTFKKEN